MRSHSILPVRDVAIGVIWHERRVLLVQRQPAVPLGGMWEFPGGKVEAGETPEASLRRELLEEVGLRIGACHSLGTFRHDYAHIAVRLHAFAADATSPTVVLRGPDASQWLPLPNVGSVSILPGSEPLVRNLLLRGAW